MTPKFARSLVVLLGLVACGPSEELLPDGGSRLDAGTEVPADGGTGGPDGGSDGGHSSDAGADAGQTEITAALAHFGANALGPDSIALVWEAREGVLTGFEVERGATATGPFSPLASFGPTTTSHVDVGLRSGETYAYRARALSGAGPSPWSQVVTVTLDQTTATAPGDPAAVQVGVLGPTGLRVGWTLPEAQSSTEVERATSEGGPYVRITITAPGALFFDDSGLTPTRTYWYRVRALRDGLASGYGGPASGTTPQVPAPPAPQGLAGAQEIANQQSTVRLTWTDVPSETHYELQRSQNGTDWQPIITIPTGAASWVDLTPFFGTNHYRLRAVNAGGASDWSSVTVYAGPFVTGYLCPPPTGSSAAALSETSARVTWTFDYQPYCATTGIERATSAEGPFVEVTRVFVPYIYPFPALTSFTFDDAGLTPGTQYFYRVRHIAMSSGWSHSPYAATVSVGTPSSLSPPTGVTPHVVSSTAVEFTWTDPSTDETGFAVEFANAAAGPFSEAFRLPANTTLSNAQGLSPATQYWVRVRTVRGSQLSEPSPAASFTTASVLVLRATADVTVFESTALSAAQHDRIGNEANAVGCYYNWTNDLDGNIYLFHHCAASLLRFDAQPLVGKNVLGASLRLTPGGIAPGPLGDAKYAVFALTAAWNPATISFNTLPPRHPDGWAVPAPTSAVASIFNVTAIAQRWATGALGLHGLYVQHFPIVDRLPPNNANAQDQMTPYCSLEEQCGSVEYVPTLVVEYF